MRVPLILDASHGEGGGQVLRTALGLAVTLRRAVELREIRVRRPVPGLRPQHVAVVRALAQIGAAEMQGDCVGSTTVRLAPGTPRAGGYRFDIGTAGSVALLLQAVLLPLLRAEGESRVEVRGGTHVPWSPPVHYLSEVFLPALRTMGVHVELRLARWGWHPAGGGEVTVTISPAPVMAAFRATERVETEVVGLSAVSRLPRSIAERQRHRAESRLAEAGLGARISIVQDDTALSPGTLVLLAAPGRAGFSALGRRGVPAERVADEAVDALLAWTRSGAAIDECLADQLVPFLALAREPSAFTCPALSSHLRTVAWVVQQLLPVRVELAPGPPARVTVDPRA